jgi:glycosyltransferase involved in cell wall biosynthesis
MVGNIDELHYFWSNCLQPVNSWQTFSQERTPHEPPIIAPVDTAARPLWSVMIPVYNGGRFLEAALRSVLGQAPPEKEMQIEVVDDYSTDIDVQELVSRVGKGRVSYFRQPCNVGSLRNFETCLNLSKGHYIHLLHSDDVIHQGYYERLKQLFDTYPEIGAAFCRYQCIDENGNAVYVSEAEGPVDCVLENWLYRLATRQRIHFASICVKRSVYEDLGGFYGAHYGGEWEMWARIATRYSFGYTPAILASYRRHPETLANDVITSARNMDDLEMVMTRINGLLPSEKRHQALHEARKYYARHALNTAHLLWDMFRNSTGALAQMQKAWSMHKSLEVGLGALRLLTRIMFRR